MCLSYGGPAVDGNSVCLPCTDGVRAVRIDSTGTLRELWHASDSVAGSPVAGGGASGRSIRLAERCTPSIRRPGRRSAMCPPARPAALPPVLYRSLVLVPTLSGVVFVHTLSSHHLTARKTSIRPE
jgi:hypothetical protein